MAVNTTWDYSQFNTLADYKNAVDARYGSGGISQMELFGGFPSVERENYYARQMALGPQALANAQAAIASAKGNKLTTEYQSAYNEAKTANEARYKDILGQYGSRYTAGMAELDSLKSEVMGGLEGLGEAEKSDIRKSYAISGAANAQALINSGLHSTTIAPAVQRQNATAEAGALSSADERLRRERLGYMTDLGTRRIGYSTGMTKEMLDFMERRTDEYPSQSLYVQLMQMLGNN